MPEERRIAKRAGALAKTSNTPRIPDIKDQIALASQLKEFTEMIGLPSQAIPAIYKAYNVRRSLMSLVEQQSNLPLEERRSLVTIERNKLLTDKSMAIVDKFAVNNAVPYNLIAWIENGPYPLTDARYYHVVMDPRGLKNIIFREDHLQLDGSSPYAMYSCRIEFWDGSYVDWETGVCSLSEVRSNPTLHGMVTRAKTRAFNRAANRCIVFIGAVPPAEEGYSAEVVDSNSFIQSTPIVQTVQPIEPTDGTRPNSYGQLFTWAAQRWGIGRAKIAEIVGVKPDTLQMVNRDEVWDKLLEWVNTQPTLTAQ